MFDYEDEPYDSWISELQDEAEAREIERWEARAAVHNELWIKQWPNYCKACNGSGGKRIYNYPHAPDDFEFCTALDTQMCHRCGAAGLTEDSEGPCTHCGWNFDDCLMGGYYD